METSGHLDCSLTISDFADNLALLSHTHRQMQEKTNSVEDSSAQVGLHINRGKTRINTTTTEPVRLDDDLLEEVNSFTYLGSVVDIQGGTEADVKARIGKARAVFLQLKKACMELQRSDTSD